MIDLASISLVKILDNVFDRLIGPIYIKLSPTGISVGIEHNARSQETIDDRLLKIESAKRNLEDALSAMNELTIAAEQNKLELASAMRSLEIIKHDKSHAERQLESIKTIAETDIQAFRKIAGVPDKLQVAKERFIGFVLGVLASLLASVFWWLLTKSMPLLKS
jgi:hypothetical protein